MILPLAFAVFLVILAVRQRGSTMDREMEVEGPCFLLDMPGEILERVLGNLAPADLVSASQVRHSGRKAGRPAHRSSPPTSPLTLQTCRALRETAKSPRLTYRYALAMRGYIDVPNRAPPPPWPADGERVEASPHTGAMRVSIPSVALARWPDKPPPAMDVSALSAAEKGRLLREREERFDRLAPAQLREFAVAGPAGVYELQDGVFLLCHERSISQDVRVRTDSRCGRVVCDRLHSSLPRSVLSHSRQPRIPTSIALSCPVRPSMWASPSRT